MTHLITITLPIDPQNYEGIDDTLDGAMTLANEMLSGAAPFPFELSTNIQSITIRPSNDSLVSTMEDILQLFASGDIKHENYQQLKDLARITLQNLEHNKQLTKEAKEI